MQARSYQVKPQESAMEATVLQLVTMNHPQDDDPLAMETAVVLEARILPRRMCCDSPNFSIKAMDIVFVCFFVGLLVYRWYLRDERADLEIVYIWLAELGLVYANLIVLCCNWHFIARNTRLLSILPTIL